MQYVGTNIPDSLSVKCIFSVLIPNLARKNSGREEWHDFPEIFYVRDGEHTVVTDEKVQTVHRGQMIIYAPGTHHSSAAPSDVSACIISFDVESREIASLYNRPITLTAEQRRVFLENFDAAVGCFKRRNAADPLRGMILCDGVDEYTLRRIKLRLELFLNDLIENAEQTTSQNKKSERWDVEYKCVLEFMKRNLRRSLTLEMIAAGCSMSVSKLKILFREKHGAGPMSCFIELKIDEAKRIIAEDRLNISEIATELGFSSLHYFSRLFKRVTAMSPSEYARSVRG